jgi:hypothetical protein
VGDATERTVFRPGALQGAEADGVAVVAGAAGLVGRIELRLLCVQEVVLGREDHLVHAVWRIRRLVRVHLIWRKVLVLAVLGLIGVAVVIALGFVHGDVALDGCAAEIAN